MAELLSGKPVVERLKTGIFRDIQLLKEREVEPTLAVVRVGSKSNDIAYEKAIIKRCDMYGVTAGIIELSENVSQDMFNSTIKRLNGDRSVHGITLLQPLPKHLNDSFARRIIDPIKDVDGVSFVNEANIYAGKPVDGYKPFAPCTPCAIITILNHYGIRIEGKNVVSVGRSMVVGRPLSMLLLSMDATVTICHTKTDFVDDFCRRADIVITSVGKPKIFGQEYFSENSIVVDAGINVGEDGKIYGDIDFAEVEPRVRAITPVPGGVGAVTTTLLVRHVITSAKLLS